MIVGIIGIGVVGGAVENGLRKLGHEILLHDIKFKNTKIQDIISSDICFICVPSPSNNDGSCDTSIVEQTVNDLDHMKYNGIIVIKSTVTPSTTVKLQKLYPERKIAFVPEFLRERYAKDDFIKNHDVCIVGTNDYKIYEKIKQCHEYFPNKFIRLTPTEAELAKYYNNLYNATLITFANSFYDVCSQYKADYSKVKQSMIHREHIFDRYLDCDENLRGFGGMCLPKDTKCISHINNDKNNFFKDLLKHNNKYKITVKNGMRE